jgi:predicted membrane channel-forming protein YqfA (hemolysin III family)
MDRSARDESGMIAVRWCATAVAAAIFTLALVSHVVGDWPRLTTLLLYCLVLVWLFGCSAIYHVVT